MPSRSEPPSNESGVARRRRGAGDFHIGGIDGAAGDHRRRQRRRHHGGRRGDGKYGNTHDWATTSTAASIDYSSRLRLVSCSMAAAALASRRRGGAMDGDD